MMSEQAERFFISVSGAVKKYGVKGNETLALNGLEFTAREGEMIAVLGKSGSGKSTLLNVLGGMDTLTAGEYFFDGQEISKYSMAKLHQFRKKNIGFVFQNFALLNRYTVYENLEAPLLDSGSAQNDLWGINLYPEMEGDDFVEFDSMINIRPGQGNRSRDVQDVDTRQRIIDTVNYLLP